MRRLAFACLFVLAGCGTTGQQSVLAACATADATLRSLTVAKAQGKLTPEQIQRIDGAVMVIDPICSAETPPETEVALRSIEMQLLVMQGVKGVQ